MMRNRVLHAAWAGWRERCQHLSLKRGLLERAVGLLQDRCFLLLVPAFLLRPQGVEGRLLHRRSKTGTCILTASCT